MGMNIMKLMSKVQDMQKKATQMQQDLANLDITSESGSGSVKVTVDGQGKFKSIKISAEAINSENPSSVSTDTIEMLEDLITAAMQDASNKASKEMESRMSQITGGIKIPGLFGA